MSRREFKWTPNQLDKLNKVQDVLNELHEYKPLTLRQVYYQLVSNGDIDNTKSQYTMLSQLVKWARIEGCISWDDIEDRVRSYRDLAGWMTADTFIEQEVDNFLQGYRREVLQSQDKYIEIWIEKDALASIFTRAALPYRVPVVVCRGFSSVSFLNDYKKRLHANRHYKPVLLYFGDFDPSGMAMLESMQVTIEQEMGIKGVEFKRVALSKDDIYKYKLPHDWKALKLKDTRAPKHLAAHGALAVELDALRPDILTQKIKDSIINEIDVTLLDAELYEQNEDLKELSKLRDKVLHAIKEAGY
jgi:hypothetical protein